MSYKQLKIFELALVLSIGFLPAIISSLYVVVTGDNIYANYKFTGLNYINSIAESLISIILMFYVLYRNGNNYKSIGLNLSISGSDIFHAFLIMIVALFIRQIVFTPVALLYPSFYSQAVHPRNVDFLHSKYISYLLLYTLVKPLHEELLVRGFTMKYVFDISNQKYLAVVISVLIQFLYHLYQGLPSALSLLPIFTVFALYFLKYGRLMPVILAHIMIDLIAVARMN
jgi:membrane protease YdiL (CAAX protease family)